MFGIHCVRDHRGKLHVVGGSIMRDHRGKLLWDCKPSIDHCLSQLNLGTAPAGGSKIRAALLARAAKK
jgi:hypothetical protein